jgi:hypothetical protein
MNWIQRNLISLIGLNNLDAITTYVNRELNGTASYNDYTTDHKKLELIFSNQALLKVFALQCDLFSIGKVYVYKDGVELKDDPFLKMIDNPNPFQMKSQFLWDVMFWNMLGNTYNYCESKIVSEDNCLYILENNKIEFPVEMDKYRDRIVLSKTERKKIDDFVIQYCYADGSSTQFKWGNIIHMPDLSNGTGNWFRGGSRIDALVKIISNAEASLDATNINVRYSGKFMVAGQADPNNVSQLPMGEPEKQDIESKMNGSKSVHAVKSMIDIKRFVENIGNLKLSEIYLDQYFLIGSMYNIPKDVLEAYNSGTYENQEKARGAFVSYCLQPKGDLFFQGHAKFFGYSEAGKDIIMDWEHLPFMQVFAKERAETEKVKSETLLNFMRAGIPIDEINECMDTNFTELNYESAQRTNQSGNSQTNTGN